MVGDALAAAVEVDRPTADVDAFAERHVRRRAARAARATPRVHRSARCRPPARGRRRRRPPRRVGRSRRVGRVGCRAGRMRLTVAACAEASRPSVARAKRRRRANWRPPPASTSASSAAFASPALATWRRSRPRSPRSRTRPVTWSSRSAYPWRRVRTAGRPGADRPARDRASWRDQPGRGDQPGEGDQPGHRRTVVGAPRPRHRRRRAAADRRRRPGGAGPRTRHAAVRLRPGALRRARAAASRRRSPRPACRSACASRSRPIRSPRSSRCSAGSGAPGTPESVGIDACSPGEVLRALECGWRPDEISYTGTNVSERDLDVLLAHGIHCNLDALSQIERYGRRAPGSRIGIRIDPGAGAGYNEHLEYSGARPTKFGVGLERLDEAHRDRRSPRPGRRYGPLPRGLRLARRRAARRSSGRCPAAVEAVERLRAAGHEVIEVNVGGGLGMPAREDEHFDRSRGVRGGRGAPPRAARRDGCGRARRPPVEGRGDPARRGRHGRGRAAGSRSSGSTSAGT